MITDVIAFGIGVVSLLALLVGAIAGLLAPE